MSRVVHFEIHASDPDRAVTFYSRLLGWDISKWDGPAPYWLVGTGPADAPGINGGIMARRGAAPAEGAAVNAFVCTVQIDALEPTLAKLAELGGSVAVPTMPIPGVGWLAYAKDPDGNIFGLMQPDGKASM